MLVPLLVLRLRRRWPRTDGDAVVTAAHDAVLWYLAEPARYNGTSARLDVFLAHVAHRRLLDAYRDGRRQQEHDASVRSAQGHFGIVGHQDPTSELGGQEDGVAIRLRLMSLVHTDVEARFLNACLTEASGRRIAAALGVEHLPASEQAHAVRRMTKRLHQRATRARGHHGMLCQMASRKTNR